MVSPKAQKAKLFETGRSHEREEEGWGHTVARLALVELLGQGLLGAREIEREDAGACTGGILAVSTFLVGVFAAGVCGAEAGLFRIGRADGTQEERRLLGNLWRFLRPVALLDQLEVQQRLPAGFGHQAQGRHVGAQLVKRVGRHDVVAIFLAGLILVGKRAFQETCATFT